MFMLCNGDRDYVWNFIVYIIGNDESFDIYDIWVVVECVERDDINIYIVGINFWDLIEINELLIYLLSIYWIFINIIMGWF